MVTAVKRSPKRKVGNLVKHLRDRIINGELSAGSMLPTPDELARSSGTSAITVNRIMTKLADEGLVNRIKGKGTFVAEKIAPRTRTYRLGVAFHLPSGETGEITAAFEVFQRSSADSIRQLGHEVRYLSHDELSNAALAEKALESVDGVILSATYNEPAVIRNLRNSGKTVVVIQQTGWLELPFHQVIPDLYRGYEKALEQFRTRGHRKIVICSFEGEEHASRIRQFVHCAINNGFPPEALITIVEPRVIADLGRMTGFKIGARIMEETDCRAIMSASDFCSFGLVDAFRSRGLQVGRDVDLISFDNLEGGGLCPFGEPLLTAIDFPRQQIAGTAVELLIHLLDAPEELRHTISIPAELIIRQSLHNPNQGDR